MKHLLRSIILCLIATLHAGAQSQIVSVTQNSGEVQFAPSDIIQIVGAVVATPAIADSSGMSTNSPFLRVTMGDGTIVDNRIGTASVQPSDTRNTFAVNNPLIGVTLTGVSKLNIQNGNAVVTVRILKQAAQFVSEPVMLPLVDDGTYTITLETSIDMTDWAPAAPGDYLTATSHRFFRVKVVKKEAATPEP